jgi:lambda family phage tail tape measure protein
MATVKINLSLEDAGKSVKARTDEVKGLNKQLEKTKQLSTGTQSGSRAVKSSLMPGMSGEGTEYGRARGGMGATGAAGRDFANQAQGLGGLVRLYATYAANVFAVSAAFNALSQAMNTTNMVKGLDQLGTASGVSLGTLAKRFEEASGGAISLRESMEATAKAVSSGLSQAQFLKLGEVALKASQALGVGMSDAVSRLTRGITKLEPELLDELGIFTKVGVATEEYARSIGKSANALTDFERRQAFANAVLAEGQKKFGEIDIPTNPYDKLLATLRNVAQSIGEIINVAIVPLVSLLASSPAALTLGIAALGSMIVKQAIPAIGEYRKSLREAAAVSKELAENKLARAEGVAEARRADIKARSEAAAELATTKVQELEDKLRNQSSGRIRKDVQKILAPTRSILDIKDSEIAKLDSIGDKLKTQNNIYKQLAATIQEARNANLAYIKTEKDLEKERQEKPSRASTLGVLRAEAEAQRKRAASSGIISQAGDTAAIDGFGVAFSQMIEKIKDEKLGRVRGTLTGIAGAASAATARLGGLVSAFSGYIAIITGAIAIYQMLSGWLSENSAQQEKFNETIEFGNDAVKALNLTYDKYRTSLSSDAIIATANAFTNLSDNIGATVKALEAADAKSGVFDRFIDGIKSVFGQDLKSDFERGIAFQVSEGLKGITDPKLKKTAEDKLKELLGIQTLTAKAISGALDDIDKSDIIAKGKSIAEVFDSASRAGEKTANTLKAVKEGFTELDRAYVTLANSLNQKDPLSDFGRELAMQGFNLAEAFKDPIASVSALRDILTDVSKIKLLAPESQAILMQNRDAFIALANSAQVYEQQILVSEKRIKGLEKQRDSRLNKAPIQRQIDREQADLAQSRARLADTKSGLEVISKEFARASEASIKKGFEFVERSFVRSMANASLSAQKSLVDMLPKTAGTIDLGVSLENQKLELQKEEILETQRLIKELELGRLGAEKRSIEAKRDDGLKTATEPSVRAALYSAAEPRLKEITEREKTLASTNISRDTRSGILARTPETLAAMQQQQGAFARVAAIASQQEMNIIKGEVDKVTALYVDIKRELDNELKAEVQKRDAYMRGEGFRNDTREQQQKAIAGYTATEAVINKQLSLLENQREITTANKIETLALKNSWFGVATQAGLAAETARKQYKFTANSVDETNKLNKEETDRNNKLGNQLATMKLQNIELEGRMKLTQLEGATQASLLDIQKQELQLQLDKGMITVDAYNQQITTLEKVERVKQRDLKLSQLLQQYTIDTTTYLNEYAAASAAQRPELQAKFATISQVYATEVNGIKTVFDATERLKDQQELLSERQMAYAELFNGAFKSMEDAIIEFSRTGKLSFSSMIDNFIEGLIRFELQQQQMALMQSVRGQGGWANVLANFIGGGSNAAGNKMFDAGMNQAAPNAKGNAFDYGIQAFAKGGAFTNQIVDSPTLFKFARGTGLMGEAGPEAIMPLKRDSSGNLGVRGPSGAGNVEVVVNNFSTAQAETRETTDSRGNRRIEVIVGDMVAQEVAKTGSATQNAFSSTYGTRPALARR